MQNYEIRQLSIDTPTCTSTILCGEGAFEKYVPELIGGRQFFVVTDSNVYSTYGSLFSGIFSAGGLYVLPAGEGSKNLNRLSAILKAILSFGLKRGGTVVAFGGGVVGDIAGLAASLYMRGTRLIQIPTTLLSQVDSSVGGKTAIDFCNVKNIVGTFYQPHFVVVDPMFLNTLPAREIRCGLGEIIKYGALNAAILEKLTECSSHLRSPEFLREITFDCIAHKAEVVRLDEREGGLRKTLNLGHTTGHAFELFYKRKSHGEFVLIGMYYELFIAESLGICSPEYAQILKNLLNKVISVPAYENAAEACRMALYDKKNVKSQEISLIVPESEGKVKEIMLPVSEYADYISRCAESLKGQKRA